MRRDRGNSLDLDPAAVNGAGPPVASPSRKRLSFVAADETEAVETITYSETGGGLSVPGDKVREHARRGGETAD